MRLVKGYCAEVGPIEMVLQVELIVMIILWCGIYQLMRLCGTVWYNPVLEAVDIV